MLKQTMIGLVLAAAGLLAHHTAHADVFRCVGAGKTMYTDQPCPSGMRTANAITAAQVCGSADCERRLERDNEEAQERRRREEEQLAILEEERRGRADEDARLEALRSREAVLPESGYPVESLAPRYPVESLDPGYPIVIVPLWTCVGARCFPLPHHPPHDPDRDGAGHRVSNDPDHRHHHDPQAPDPHPGTTHVDGRHDSRSPGHDGGAPRLGADERPLGGSGRS